MIKFFRRNQQFLTAFSLIYGIAVVFASYFNIPFSQYAGNPVRVPFIPENFHLINQDTYLLFIILVTIILLFIGFYLTRMMVNFLIISSRSQFPAIFFFAIAAFAFNYDLFSGAIISSFLLLLSIERIFGSVDRKSRPTRFFDSGLLIGIASFFYFNTIFLLPFFLITQVTLKPASWREIIYIFIGVFLPFLYIFSWYFLMGNSFSATWQRITGWVFVERILIVNPYFWMVTGIFILVILISSFYALRVFASTKIIVRKYYQLLFILFINLGLVFILIPSTGFEIFFLAAIPASVPLSLYFTQCRDNIFNRILLLLILIMPVVVTFLHH